MKCNQVSKKYWIDMDLIFVPNRKPEEVVFLFLKKTDTLDKQAKTKLIETIKTYVGKSNKNS